MHNGLSSGYVIEYNSEQLCFCNFSSSFLCDVRVTEAHPYYIYSFSILKLCGGEKDSKVEKDYGYFDPKFIYFFFQIFFFWQFYLKFNFLFYFKLKVKLGKIKLND